MITTSQWRRAVLPVLDTASEWAFRGKVAYRTPLDWFILGVHAEGSAFDRDRVYISALAMPLFIPSDHLILSHSMRVPNGSSACGLDDLGQFRLAVQKAVEVLPSQESALRVVAASRSEESAYASLILGSVEEAERSLGSIYEPDDDRPFIDEARARRAEVFARLRADGPEAATRLLRRWRDGTAMVLGVA